MHDSGLPFATSYFSEPSQTLDPTLFEGRHLKSWVKQGILTLLYDHLGKDYRQPESWAHAWLAGSGVSYQWSAARQPGDLDCLVGVDYIHFRKANPEFAGLGDREISEYLNEGFRSELQPKTANWNGYELTFYVNPGATDIRTIKPYAAYDLKYDEWTVSPDPSVTAPQNPAWEAKVSNDRSMAAQIVTRFTQALNDVSVSHNDATRRNAENRLLVAAQQGTALFDEIHESRSKAFSTTGEGYADFNNYRWQAGKREGTIQMLRKIKEHAVSAQQQREQSLYGVELPDAHSAIRYAAIQGAKQ
jgi:hypothetical protein